MTATVNEEWTWDVTAREAGAVEAGVRIYTWDTLQTVDVDQTTDAGGVIPQQQVRQNQYNDSGAGFATTGFNPYRIRALKYGLNMFGVDQNFEAPTRNTFFLSVNPSITEAVKATVDAYTGITYNHTVDSVTLDGTGITPVNNVDRLYDHTQTEAVDVPQYDFLEIMSTGDGQNYTLQYALFIIGFDMDYQSRSITMAPGRAVIWQGSITGPISNLTVTGDVALEAQTDMTNVTINGDMSFDFGAANVVLDFTNVTVTGDMVNDGTGTLTINSLSGSSLTTSEPGTGAGQINIVATNQLELTGLVVGSEVRPYVGGTSTQPELATEIPGGIENVPSSTYAFSQNEAGNVGYIRIVLETYEDETIDLTYANNDQSIPVNQRFDRNFKNPPG